jgi:hypothetical protein
MRSAAAEYFQTLGRIAKFVFYLDGQQFVSTFLFSEAA